MQTRPLGASGVSISTIGLGGVELGPEEGEEPAIQQAIDVVRIALESGVNWIDTSEAYHGTRNETLIGETLQRAGADMLVATKLAPRPRGTGFRADEVEAGCRASMKRLARDMVDVYFLHYPDETSVPLEESWVRSGSRTTRSRRLSNAMPNGAWTSYSWACH